jgi:hypothetical protein
MTRNPELEGAAKEVVVAYFTIPFRHLVEGVQGKPLKSSVTIVESSGRDLSWHMSDTPSYETDCSVDL